MTARSLLEDGDLDLANQLPGDPRDHDGEVALSVDGRLVPKHPIVMAVAALPFVALFGRIGALVFNFAQIAALLLVLYALARRVSSAGVALVATLSTAAASALPHYVWNFSPNVFAALLLSCALLALDSARGRAGSWLAGFVLGLTCVAKFSLLIFVPGVLLLCPAPLRRSLPPVALGMAVPFAAFALFNVHLFGSPLTTSYDRIAMLAAHPWTVHSQRADFVLPLRVGMKLQTLDRTHGLLFTSPVTLLSLPGFLFLARRRAALALYLFASALGLFLFFSTYRLWYTSHHGNRFLLPAALLFAVPLAALIEGLRGRRRAGRLR